MINKNPHSPGRWLSRAGSRRPPSLALPTMDRGRIQGAGSGWSGPPLAAASHPCASRAFKGKLPEELKDKLQQELLLPRGGRQGLLLRAPLGPWRPQPPPPQSSRASTGCRLRMGNEPQKGRRKIHRKPLPCTSGSGILDGAGRRRGLKQRAWPPSPGKILI